MVKKIVVALGLALVSALMTVPASAAPAPAVNSVTVRTYRWVAGRTFHSLHACSRELPHYIDGYYVTDAYCVAGPNGEAVMFLRQIEGLL